MVHLKFFDHSFRYNELIFVDVLDYECTSDCEVISKKQWTILRCKELIKRENS